MRDLIKEKYWLYRIKYLKDSQSFAEVYDKYIEKIYRFIYFKVGSEDEAKDLASETFLRAWQYLGEGKPVKNLNAFLYKVARNLVIDFYREKAERRDREITITPELVSSLGQKDREFLKIENRTDMDTAVKGLRMLKEEYREVIILRYIDELNVEQIAEVMGKTKNNVRVLLSRALRALNEVLNQQLIKD